MMPEERRRGAKRGVSGESSGPTDKTENGDLPGTQRSAHSCYVLQRDKQRDRKTIATPGEQLHGCFQTADRSRL